MDLDLEQAHLQIMQAGRPEDLFGAEDVVLPPEMLKEYLKAEYDRFRLRVDPANFRFPEDIEMASEAIQKLDALYQDGILRIDRYHFALPGWRKTRPSGINASFKVGKNHYFRGAKIDENDWSAIYEGFLEHNRQSLGEVSIKVVTEATENSLAENELRILDILHRVAVPQWKHLPLILDRFTAGGRVGLIFRKISGYTLTQVRAHPLHASGVDRRDTIWMLDRALSLLGYVHRSGVVHGAISPDTFQIQPENHNALIIDWSGAVYNPAVRGERCRVISELFGAPEVKSGEEIGPWSDIYSLGKLFIWLVGGDPITNQIPESVEKPLSDFLLRMVHPSRFQRPSDAWSLYEEETRIKDSLWKRGFRHFDMS